jgi:CubicO group peptidase (beta-lactamase class C family)
MIVKPEEVGLSSPRLARIGEHLQRYIDAGKLAGTLTLIARRRKVAYLEAQGHLEIERRRPVTQDSVFRIYSMTKPITSVGLMMLYEQGRLQLDDPVHRFIPSWREQKVFVGGNHPTWKTVPVDRPMTVRRAPAAPCAPWSTPWPSCRSSSRRGRAGTTPSPRTSSGT